MKSKVNRRDFISGASGVGVGLILSGGVFGVLKTCKLFNEKPTDPGYFVPEGQRRSALLVCNGLNSVEIKHVIFDDSLMGEPYCYRQAEIENGLEKCSKGHWRPILVDDPKLFEAIGEIPSEGKLLPKDCYLSTAKWLALALRTSWPHAAPIDGSITFVEKTETHKIFVHSTLEGKILCAVRSECIA